MDEAATVIQAYTRGYLARKRNRDVDLVFGAVVAEVQPDKLLNFWDCVAISRRPTKHTSKPEASQKSKSTDCQSILTELNSLDFQEPTPASSTLNIDTSPTKILIEAGFNPRSLTRSKLDSKRTELLSELWWLQSAILSRRETIFQNNQPATQPVITNKLVQ